MKVLLTVLALAAVAHASLSVNYNDPQDKCEFCDRTWQSGWGMELIDLLTFRTCQKKLLRFIRSVFVFKRSYLLEL